MSEILVITLGAGSVALVGFILGWMRGQDQAWGIIDELMADSFIEAARFRRAQTAYDIAEAIVRENDAR